MRRTYITQTGFGIEKSMTTMITCRPEHSGLSRRRPTRGKMSMGSLLIPPRLVVPAIVLLLVPLTANGQGDPARARAAAVRALPMLQRSVRTFAENRSCVSCHHNSVAVLTLRMARRHGLAVDAAVLEAVETKTFRQLRSATAVDTAVQAVGMSDPTPSDSYLLMAAHEARLPADLATATWAARIARWQLEDGHWTTSDFRPPHSGSLFTATATAVRAIQAYMPAELVSDRNR